MKNADTDYKGIIVDDNNITIKELKKIVGGEFGLGDTFDIMVMQEGVKELKTCPECYLNVMQMADISAEQTVIFEDSDAGVQAALDV